MLASRTLLKLNGPVQQADGMTQRRFSPGQFAFRPAASGGRRFAQLGRGLQRGPYPAGPVGIALLDHPDQRPRRLGEPVLQVSPGPADLAFYQAGGLTAQMLPGRPPAEFAGKPAADRTGQQLGLADVLRRGVKEPPVLGQPTARLGDLRGPGRATRRRSRGARLSSASRPAASRASTWASPCSMASCRCWRQASAAASASAASCARPRRSISAGAAVRSSPSSSVPSCPVISRPSRGASSSAASFKANSSRADSPSATATASRLRTATSASRALNCSTRWAASPARISAARRVSATSSSRELAIRRACATADARRSAFRRASRYATKSASNAAKPAS